MTGFISDFDGTLFFREENPQIRKKDVEAIHEFQKENKFCLCTGRTWAGVKVLEEYNVYCDYYIVNSGAMILNKNQEVIYEKRLNPAIVQEIIDQTHAYDCAILSKNQIYWVDHAFFQSDSQTIIHSVEDVQEPIVAISLHADSEKEAYEACKKINAQFDVQALQNDVFVDIVAPGCSKGKAIEYLRNHLNISYVAAIGDSYNDIDMLEQANHAFTFASSPRHVQEVADQLVSDIAQAIDYTKNNIKNR